MFKILEKTISNISVENISTDRKLILDQLAKSLQKILDEDELILLNFICTHNSRRSHLAQIWAQTAVEYYHLKNIKCYSGGTEVTHVYTTIIETLISNGFSIQPIAIKPQPIYLIKSGENSLPIIGFSKKYDHLFNPQKDFIAISTCSQVDEQCPIIHGAKYRFALPYDDPKIFDDQENEKLIYNERSLQIANEMFYVFKFLK